MDQLPCGSVLTPAISCTKSKIHSAYTDSPMAKIISFNFFLTEHQSLLYRPRTSGRECAWWINSLVGQYLHQLSLVQSSRSSQQIIQIAPWLKHYFFQFFTQDQSLLHRLRNSGRECAWWTNSPVGQYLHQLSLAQSSRYIQHMQTVPWPKHLFFNFLGRKSLHFTLVFFSIFYRGPVIALQTKNLRKRMCMVDQLPCVSVLTPAISCTKFKIYSAYADGPMAKTFIF